MKLEANFQKFREAISVVDKIAGKHITLPVLSCILFEVNKNTVTLKTTNLDIGVEASFPVKTSDIGVFAVPAAVISAFVSQIHEIDQVVRLEIISGNLHITSSKSKGVIKTVPPEDFPIIPKVDNGQDFVIQSKVFTNGFKSVWYSSSISNIKPELSSVYVYKDGNYMNFVATDSFRLAEKKIKISHPINFNDTLIPFKNISDLVRLLENIQGEVTVKSNKNLISFETDSIYLVSRVIDGVFPDYKQIIPSSYSTEAIVLKQDFINALKISNVFSDKFNHIKMLIDPKGKRFEVRTKNSDIGENNTEIDAALTGDKLEANFNYKYIADCFQSIDADSVSIQLSGMNKPMVIRPISSEQTFMYLVMPMNR